MKDEFEELHLFENFDKVKEILKALFDKYGYVDENRNERIFDQIFYGMQHIILSEEPYTDIDCYELVKLIKTLRQCKKVKITGTIENPQNDTERKGQPAEAEICDEGIFRLLDSFLNTILEHVQGDFYEMTFNWEKKGRNKDADPYFNFTKVYNEKELDLIYKTEEMAYNRYQNNSNLSFKQKRGNRFSLVKRTMLEEGFFSGESKGKAREYAFIYDFFVATRKISVPKFEMTNSEKFDHVKECIETHQNYLEKIKKLNKKRIKNILLNWNNSWKK